MNTVISFFKTEAEETKVRTDFEQLYDEYWEKLFKQIIRILPDEDDVVDVIQQSFVDLWEIRDRMPEIKSLKSFIFIIARNLAFKKLRERLKKDEYREYYVNQYHSAGLNPELRLEFKELDMILEKHIDCLPQKMKEVFLLSRKHNLSYLEIAQQLNITDNTVKKQISNALKILRLKIDQDYISYLMLIYLMDILVGV